MTETAHSAIRAFMIESFLFGDESGLPADNKSLIANGIVNSTGVLELVAFIEDTFGFTMADADITPENLNSVDNIAAFVARAGERAKAA